MEVIQKGEGEEQQIEKEAMGSKTIEEKEETRVRPKVSRVNKLSAVLSNKAYLERESRPLRSPIAVDRDESIESENAKMPHSKLRSMLASRESSTKELASKVKKRRFLT